MGTHILNWITNFLSTVGYPGVFLLMLIEGFGIPIPSELTMPFSGYLTSSAPAAHHQFTLPLAIAAGTLGEVSGGAIAYYVGFRGGRPALERYGRLVLLSPAELERGEQWFGRYGNWVVLGVRLLPAVRSFIALPAGVVRMPFWQFLFYSAIGSLAWCTGLALVGHFVGANWDSVSGKLRPFEVVIVVVVLALIAFGIYKRITAGHEDEERNPVTTAE